MVESTLLLSRAVRRLALGLALLSLGCPAGGGGSSQPQAAITPVLEAVLLPGPWLRFARFTPNGGTFEALPSSLVILRMANSFPGSDRIRVSLIPVAGAAAAALAWVGRTDAAGKQALAGAGFFEVVVDNYGYSILVTPPPAQRTGSGFDLAVVNTTPNPPAGTDPNSATLTVKVRPTMSRTLPSAVFFDCGTDYDDIDGRWHWNCKESASRVTPELTLQGWMEAPASNCLSGLCIEDFHYDFVPDVDFIDEYYGPLGVVASIVGNTAALEGLAVVGNPRSTAAGVPIADQKPDGSNRGITINSFTLPENHPSTGFPRVVMKAELNAWHVASQGGLFSRHWVGRGAAPAGWTTPVIDANDRNVPAWANTSWPFDPFDPDAMLSKVAAGEYVRITGPLWQDGPHDGPAGAVSMAGSPWSFRDIRTGAWLEIHPVDWLDRRIAAPPMPKTPVVFELIDYDQNTKSKSLSIMPTADRPAGAALRCRELIDGRLTDMKTVTRHEVVMSDAQVDVRVEVKRKVARGPHRGYVAPGALITPGRFKAVFVVWWEAGPAEAECRTQ